MIEYIADASSNHCGSLETMYKMIKSAKESGATIFKVQHWVTERFINKERFEKLKIAHQKDWASSVFDTYKRYEIPLEWFPKIKRCCDDNNIEFMNSEYDLESFDYTNQFVKRIKVGSGDITYKPLLEKAKNTKKDIFLATGASTYEEVIEARNFLQIREQIDSSHIKYVNDILLFKCNTNYSAGDNENIKHLNLLDLDLNDERDNYYIGYSGISDHTKSDIPIIVGVYKGIEFFERHFQLEPNSSPDSKFSLNPAEWKHMVNIGNQTLLSIGKYRKKTIEKNEQETRVVQRRSKIDNMRPDLEYTCK